MPTRGSLAFRNLLQRSGEFYAGLEGQGKSFVCLSLDVCMLIDEHIGCTDIAYLRTPKPVITA